MNKNIYLVGFMGTGKTEAAKLLSKRLGLEFIDMDCLIEAREGASIPEIFKSKGEVYFRMVEKEVAAGVAKKDGFVVACGGGTFVDPDNIKILKSSGTVICLLSSPEVILKRISGFTHRPLVNVDNPLEKIRELLFKRMSSYKQAHYLVDCDKLSIEETVQEVLKCLN